MGWYSLNCAHNLPSRSQPRPPTHCTACTAGWYGHDCARKQAGLPLEPSLIPQRSWLSRNVKEAVAALEPPPKPTRKRPLIYVYDLEPLYSQKMLQYRCGQGGGAVHVNDAAVQVRPGGGGQCMQTMLQYRCGGGAGIALISALELYVVASR